MAALDSDIQASGGDYVDPDAWWSAVPSTPTGRQRGMCAAEDFVPTAEIFFDGKTLTSGNEAELIPQVGAGWLDEVPFTAGYNTSKARVTADMYDTILVLFDPYILLTDMQIVQLGTSGGGGGALVLDDPNQRASGCYIENRKPSNITLDASNDNYTINCVIVSVADSIGMEGGYDPFTINCTMVKVGTAGTELGADGAGGDFPINNTAILNFGTDFDASGLTGDYNAGSDTTAVGANSVDSVPFSTATFKNITQGSLDLQPVAGSLLNHAGNADMTNAPNDALGVLRVAGAGNSDIGAFEANIPRYLNPQQEEGATGATLTHSSYVVPAGINKKLIVVVHNQEEADPPNVPTGVTFDGNAMTSIISNFATNYSPFSNRITIFEYDLGATTPTGDIVLTMPNTDDILMHFIAITVTKLAQQVAEASVSTFDDDNTSISDIITTVTADAVILSGASQDATTALVWTGTGHKELGEIIETTPDSGVTGMGFVEAQSATTYTAGNSGGAAGWSLVLAAFEFSVDEATPTIEQKTFRFYDDGTESGSSALADADTAITIGKETTFHQRVGAQSTNDLATQTAKLQYRPVIGGGAWIDVKDA